MRVLEDLLQVWLVTTDHLLEGVWFRDEEDFKMAMNLVAVLAFSFPVEILAFTLMSNHVHFVVAGSHDQTKRFIKEFKRRYSQYVRKKYGIKEFLRGNGVDIRPLEGMDEAQEWGIAYVQMNCVAANICLSPVNYPWGTGNTFPGRARPADASWASFPAVPASAWCIASRNFLSIGLSGKRATSCPNPMCRSIEWKPFSVRPGG